MAEKHTTSQELQKSRGTPKVDSTPVLIPYHPKYHERYPATADALITQGLTDVRWINALDIGPISPPAVTLNHALASVDAPYFYTCDAHMVVEPDIHERMCLYLAEHPDAAVIHGFAYHWQVAKGPWSHSMLSWQYSPVPCLSLWNTNVINAVGGFNPIFEYGHIILMNLRLFHHGYGPAIYMLPPTPDLPPGELAVIGTHRFAGHHIDPDMDLLKFLRLHYIAGVCMARIEQVYPQNPYILQFRHTFNFAQQLTANRLGALMKSVCHGLNVLGCVEGFDLIPRGLITSAEKEVRYIFEEHE